MNGSYSQSSILQNQKIYPIYTHTSKPDKGNNDGFMIQSPDDNGEYFDNIKAWFVSYRNYSSLSIK